jgi:hypothetical protein
MARGAAPQRGPPLGLAHKEGGQLTRAGNDSRGETEQGSGGSAGWTRVQGLAHF